jgi:hypothetical protein
MGSDLCLANLPFKMSIEEIKKGKWKKILIDEVNKAKINDDWDLDYFGDIVYKDDIDGIKTIKDHIIEAINDFNVERRDVTTFQYGDVINVVSGGMSCGDSPTDMYDTLSIIGILPSEILSKAKIVFDSKISSADKISAYIEKDIIATIQNLSQQEQDALMEKIKKVLINK